MKDDIYCVNGKMASLIPRQELASHFRGCFTSMAAIIETIHLRLIHCRHALVHAPSVLKEIRVKDFVRLLGVGSAIPRDYALQRDLLLASPAQ